MALGGDLQGPAVSPNGTANVTAGASQLRSKKLRSAWAGGPAGSSDRSNRYGEVLHEVQQNAVSFPW